jgi:hypothetical protein
VVRVTDPYVRILGFLDQDTVIPSEKMELIEVISSIADLYTVIDSKIMGKFGTPREL